MEKFGPFLVESDLAGNSLFARENAKIAPGTNSFMPAPSPRRCAATARPTTRPRKSSEMADRAWCGGDEDEGRRRSESLGPRTGRQRTDGVCHHCGLSLRVPGRADLSESRHSPRPRHPVRDVWLCRGEGSDLRQVRADRAGIASWRALQCAAPDLADAVQVGRFSRAAALPQRARGGRSWASCITARSRTR